MSRVYLPRPRSPIVSGRGRLAEGRGEEDARRGRAYIFTVSRVDDFIFTFPVAATAVVVDTVLRGYRTARDHRVSTASEETVSTRSGRTRADRPATAVWRVALSPCARSRRFNFFFVLVFFLCRVCFFSFSPILFPSTPLWGLASSGLGARDRFPFWFPFHYTSRNTKTRLAQPLGDRLTTDRFTLVSTRLAPNVLDYRRRSKTMSKSSYRVRSFITQ